MDIEKFWARIDVRGKDECWPWIGGTSKGYGTFSSEGQIIGAHRLAYILAFGEIPAGMLIRHTCDNPPCCNPAHLLVGTHRDNARDREMRNRSKSGRQQLAARRDLACKGIDKLEQKVRSRPGAAERIDSRTEAIRTALRLAELRKQLDSTQAELAGLMATTQENVSRIERAGRTGGNLYLSSLQSYVGALGGRLEINAVFEDDVIPLSLTEGDKTLA